MTTEIKKAPVRVAVKLKKAHTHAGVDRKAGDEIEITEKQAVVLKAQGVI